MARRPGGILASLTVGELAFLRVVGRWHRDGAAFCSTEVTRRGGDENVKLFRGIGRDGIAEVCDGLVSKGLLRRERGTHRYSLTPLGVGGVRGAAGHVLETATRLEGHVRFGIWCSDGG